MNLNTQPTIEKRRSRSRRSRIYHHDKTDSNSIESLSQPPVEIPVSSSKI